MNITTSSRVQERAASCSSGSNFETNLRLGLQDLVKHPLSREETESDRILIWMIDMQKWIATHAHVEVRVSAKRRKPRTRQKIRYEARMIGHRRWRATRRRKGSDLQMAQRAIVAKCQDVQDTQDFSNVHAEKSEETGGPNHVAKLWKRIRRGASPEVKQANAHCEWEHISKCEERELFSASSQKVGVGNRQENGTDPLQYLGN